jgi:hypothetical protein
MCAGGGGGGGGRGGVRFHFADYAEKIEMVAV